MKGMATGMVTNEEARKVLAMEKATKEREVAEQINRILEENNCEMHPLVEILKSGACIVTYKIVAAL